METDVCIWAQQVMTGAVNLGQRERAHSLLKVLEVRMNLSLNPWSLRFEESFFRVSATIPGDCGIKGHGCSFLTVRFG